MWTRENLSNLVKEKLLDYPFIVVSNREPYTHVFAEGEVVWNTPTSGLTVALDPVVRACKGTWIAFGSGDADREVVDENNKVGVPPDNPLYSLRRVWLSKEEEEGYYNGFSNGALWPLCHISYTKPVFLESDWNIYKKVNGIFASNILEEIGDKKAFVFIQDYHLALVSRMIREKNPNVITAQFWHIPWPNPEIFGICPWQEEILYGLLGNDLLGFHTSEHCRNFLDTVERSLGASVDTELHEVTLEEKKTSVSSFPISVDFEQISESAQTGEVTAEIDHLKGSLGIKDEKIGIGLDRIDYTKGIPDRLRAMGRFMEKYPQYIGKVVFIQGGVPSRTEVEAYRKLNEEIDSLVNGINKKYSRNGWEPIIYLREYQELITLRALLRMADFAVVSSLHDGMNLVAKEFVASRFDENGVLILSRFTGAAHELTDALLMNPYSVDHFADAIKTALEMPEDEKKGRMVKMREVVREYNIYKWAADIISAMVKFE